MALGRILSQISFGSVLNISASLASPVLPEDEYVDALLADLDQDLHAAYGRDGQ